MAQVFSWKVAPNKYSYLIPNERGEYVRDRITDSNALHSMAMEVSNMSENEYEMAFNNMKAEVNRIYHNLDGSWRDYYDISTIKEGTVVLLSGKDGYGSGGLGGDGDGSGLSDLLSEGDYQALEDAIEKEFEKYREDLEDRVDEIKDAIADAVSADIGEALDNLAHTQEELEAMREELLAAAASAQTAINAARELFEGNSEITPEAIENVMRNSSYFNDWLNGYSGSVKDVKYDYDRAKEYLGSIGRQEDVARGLFTMMCANINALSGTVGTIQHTMDPSQGLDQAIVTWYEENAQSMTELYHTLNAQESYIQDLVNFVNGSETSSLWRAICGKTATMIDSIDHWGTDDSGQTQDVTHIERSLNGLSGVVKTQIDRLNVASGTLVTMKDVMDANSATWTQSMTVAQSAMTAARDMRETWDSEIGILTTVSDMVIKKDGEGIPIYWYVGPDGTEHERAYYQGEDSDGLPYYTLDKNGSGTTYTENVLPDYMSAMLSYIQQNSDSIEFVVTSGDVITALRMTVEQDGQTTIYGLADKVLLDADVIAKSLTANKANIGGVRIGKGEIWYTGPNSSSTYYHLTSAGTLEARNAKISGAISATSLYLGSTYGGQSLADYVSSEIEGAIEDVDGMTSGQVNTLIGKYIGSNAFKTALTKSGYTTSATLQTWVRQNYANSASVVTSIANALEGATINMPLSATTNSDGSTTFRVKISGTTYTWDRIDADGFVAINRKVGTGTTGSSSPMTLISTDGLLTANNAIIYGAVYASEGQFTGTISGSRIYGGELYGTSIEISENPGQTETVCKFGLSDDSTYLKGVLSTTLNKEIVIYLDFTPAVELGSGQQSQVGYLGCRIPAGSTTAYTYYCQNKASINGGGWIGNSDYRVNGQDLYEVGATFTNVEAYDLSQNYGKTIVYSAWTATSLPQGVSHDTIIGTVLYGSISTGRGFRVSSDGKMEAYDANINGNITMNAGNQIVMVDSNNRQKFVLSSSEVSMDDYGSTFIVQNKTFNAYSSYQGEGYPRSTTANVYSTLVEFSKSASDVYSSRPTINITMTNTGTQGTSYAGSCDLKIFILKNGSVVSGSEKRMAGGNVTYNLANYLNDSDSGNFEVRVTGFVWSMAVEQRDAWANTEVKFVSNGNIVLNRSSVATSCFKIGSNGIQMVLPGGSSLVFGLFNGLPAFRAELKVNNTTKAGISMDTTNGITYWPLNGSSYKRLT